MVESIIVALVLFRRGNGFIGGGGGIDRRVRRRRKRRFKINDGVEKEEFK